MSNQSSETGDTITRMRAGFRAVAEARRSAGVKPGEPLLGLDLDEGPLVCTAPGQETSREVR